MTRRTGKEGLHTRVVKKRRKEDFLWTATDEMKEYHDMKIPFPTTDEQKMKLSNIIVRMVNSGLSVERIVLAGALAYWDQGMFELFEMWSEEDIRGDRSEAVLTWSEIERSLDYHRRAVK